MVARVTVAAARAAGSRVAALRAGGGVGGHGEDEGGGEGEGEGEVRGGCDGGGVHAHGLRTTLHTGWCIMGYGVRWHAHSWHFGKVL